MLLMVVYVRYVNEDMLKIMNYCVFELFNFIFEFILIYM